MKRQRRDTTKRGKGRRHSSRSTPAGREIIAALTEAVQAVERGEPISHRFTVRSVIQMRNPLPYDGPAVRATRNVVGASQAVFAQLLGVSTILVQSWENGKRKPAAWACRLLDEVNRDPQHWRQMFDSHAAVAS